MNSSKTTDTLLALILFVLILHLGISILQQRSNSRVNEQAIDLLNGAKEKLGVFDEEGIFIECLPVPDVSSTTVERGRKEKTIEVTKENIIIVEGQRVDIDDLREFLEDSDVTLDTYVRIKSYVDSGHEIIQAVISACLA